MDKRRVVVTGMGVVAPNGIGIKNFWNSLIQGRSAVQKITHFDASSYPCQIAAEVRDFDPIDHMNPKSARRMDRFAQFAVACTRMAFEDARIEISEKNSDRIGIAMGSALGGFPLADQQYAIFLEKGLKRVDPLLATKTYRGKHKSSFDRIRYQRTLQHHRRWLRSGYGRDGVWISGNQEPPCGNNDYRSFRGPSCPTHHGFIFLIGALSERNEEPDRASRPFDKERDGFVMSEGGATLILEDLQHALERGAPIYAEVLSYATTIDAYKITHPLPSGEQARKAIELAIQAADLRPSDIDYINAHGSSTPINDQIETQVIKEVFGEYAYRIPISSNKSMIGHALGAAGAIELIASVLTIKNQFIPPTINYEFPDPECDLDYVPNTGRRASVTHV